MASKQVLILATVCIFTFLTLTETAEGRSFHPRFRRQFYGPPPMSMGGASAQAGSSTFGLGGMGGSSASAGTQSFGSGFGGMGMNGASAQSSTFSSGGGMSPFGYPGGYGGIGGSNSFASANTNNMFGPGK